MPPMSVKVENATGECMRISRGKDKAGYVIHFKSQSKHVAQITERAAHGIHRAWNIALEIGEKFVAGEVQISDVKTTIRQMLAVPVEG